VVDIFRPRTLQPLVVHDDRQEEMIDLEASDEIGLCRNQGRVSVAHMLDVRFMVTIPLAVLRDPSHGKRWCLVPRGCRRH
jgi:hypothetical protein